MRRAVAVVALVLIAGGIALLAYAPLTDLYAGRQQARLRRQFAASVALTARTAASGLPGGKPVALQEAIAVLKIPAIGLDAVVVQGTGAQSLRTGPGHYAGTPGPCAPGDANTAIAGHRTTYGHPFNRLDELVAGEDITLTTPAGSCTYEILPALEGRERPAGTVRPDAAAWIIAPNDWSVVSPLTAAGSYLTLTTCNPKGSASQRLVVRGRLITGH